MKWALRLILCMLSTLLTACSANNPPASITAAPGTYGFCKSKGVVAWRVDTGEKPPLDFCFVPTTNVISGPEPLTLFVFPESGCPLENATSVAVLSTEGKELFSAPRALYDIEGSPCQRESRVSYQFQASDVAVIREQHDGFILSLGPYHIRLNRRDH